MPSWEFSSKNAILLRILLVGEIMFSVGLEKCHELTLILRARRLFIPSPFSSSFLFKFPRPEAKALPHHQALSPPVLLLPPSSLTLVRGWWSACSRIAGIPGQNSAVVCLSLWFTVFSVPCFRIWYP